MPRVLAWPLCMTMAEPISARPVAAVTGGLGGIGGGIVVALTQRGFDVVVCDRSIDPAAGEILQGRAARDTRLSFVRGCVATLGEHHRVVYGPFKPFGRVR